MEIINKKYLIKTKNSIIFMRGGILFFSTNKGLKWKKMIFHLFSVISRRLCDQCECSVLLLLNHNPAPLLVNDKYKKKIDFAIVPNIKFKPD